MKSLISIQIVFLLFISGQQLAYAQSWTPSSEGLFQSYQRRAYQHTGFEINFKPNGPFGKDWIYGTWLDSDSIRRGVAYREGGKWVSLPFSFNQDSYTGDIVQYGDTMYIGGTFINLIIKGDSTHQLAATIIKFHKDSIWTSPLTIAWIFDMEASGDSLLIEGVYMDPDTVMGGQMLTADGGVSWREAFYRYGPDSASNWGGPRSELKLRGGDIYFLYEGYGQCNGVVRWDGVNWHGFGNNFNGFSWMVDFEFYNDEIYLGGVFSRGPNNENPDNGIVKFNGSNWEEVGGGINGFQGGIVGGGVIDIFLHNGLLYCFAAGDRFGDAYIPYLASWDGHQWCGTPINYVNSTAPDNFGFIKDTLYSVYSQPTGTVNGDPLSYINAYIGDYSKGPGSVCSTLGIGYDEFEYRNDLIQIFPNPSKGIFHFHFSDGIKEAELSIKDISGKIVHIEKGIAQSDLLIDLSNRPAGIYILQVTSEKGVSTHRLVKE